jgi:tRNA (guanine37-N1)-methyltransferase
MSKNIILNKKNLQSFIILIIFVNMQFDIITIFPEMFKSYFSESIIKRAQDKKLIKINIHNLRDYTKNKHKTVDDTPYGGGAGMVLKVEPIFAAVQKLKTLTSSANKQKSRLIGEQAKTILLSAKGKKFDQKMARKFSKLDQIILICGRYEGVDERVAKHIADEEISIGDYVLTGGELPAMIITDAVSRLVSGVIKKESLLEESFSFDKKSGKKNKLQVAGCKLQVAREYPQYTKPEVFKKWRVPKILLSGNHKKIEEWKQKHTK